MNYFDEMDEISVMIFRWEKNLCPDCGAHTKIVLGYMQKCSIKPDKHSLCNSEFYLKKIKEVIEKCQL